MGRETVLGFVSPGRMQFDFKPLTITKLVSLATWAEEDYDDLLTRLISEEYRRVCNEGSKRT